MKPDFEGNPDGDKEPEAIATLASPVDEGQAEVVAWLETFAACVRSADYAGGERLFAQDVVGFGTVGILLRGRDTLVSRQWKKVWEVTSGFCFRSEDLTCRVVGDVAWVAAPWSSTGHRPDGPFERRGRATYVLRRDNGRWLAVHCHHSLDPNGTPPDLTPQA